MKGGPPSVASDATMFPIILLALGALLVIVGSVADLRWREVPDWSNYAGIAAAILIRGIYSLGTASYAWILEGLAGLFVMWLLAMALFYLGQWGGGDSKLLMALGAIFGLSLSDATLLGPFLLNLLIFGGLWGGVWSARLALAHQAAVVTEYQSLMKRASVIHAKTICYLVALVLLIAALWVSGFQARLPLIILAATAITTFYIWGFAKSVESACFIRAIAVDKLEEGDWIQDDVIVKGKRICGPDDLGVSAGQIKALARAGVKKVTVKEGVPFVPSFLLAYAATLAWGNLFSLLALYSW